jgi:RNA polymerase sigma-70 factor (ECF subfamily)
VQQVSLSRTGAPRDTDDNVLVWRVAARQCGPSLAEIYRRYAPELRTLAESISGSQDTGEDIVHEAFERAQRHAHTFDPARGSLGKWLEAIVRNAAVDDRRRRKVRARGANNLRALVAAPDLWTNVGEGAERTEAVRRVLVRLPREQYLVLKDSFVEGRSYSEIAERDRVPLGTVKSRAARALDTLRSTFGVVNIVPLSGSVAACSPPPANAPAPPAEAVPPSR